VRCRWVWSGCNGAALTINGVAIPQAVVGQMPATLDTFSIADLVTSSPQFTKFSATLKKVCTKSRNFYGNEQWQRCFL
jgi:hypothetical protein